MKKLNEKSPEVEYNFLKNNAIFILIFGLMMLFFVLENYFPPALKEQAWISVASASIMILILIYLMLNALKYSTFLVNRQAYWFGNFHDEYLDHVNTKGNKYALAAAGVFLGIGLMLGESWVVEQQIISFKDYVQLNAAVLALTYGISVLCLLRGEHD